MIYYVSRTGTRRNLAAIRDAGFRILVSRAAEWRSEGFQYCLDPGAWGDHHAGRAFDADGFERLIDKMGAGADLDDGLTLEVNRTCTLGTRNGNSMLYGAVRAAAWAMGYRRVVTYTQAGEGGASLRGAGFLRVREMEPRKSWHESRQTTRRDLFDVAETGDVARVLWMVERQASNA